MPRQCLNVLKLATDNCQPYWIKPLKYELIKKKIVNNLLFKIFCLARQYLVERFWYYLFLLLEKKIISVLIQS